MLPSLNYDPNDPKFILLSKIFKIIDSKKKYSILILVVMVLLTVKMMDLSIKVIFIKYVFFDYPISKKLLMN